VIEASRPSSVVEVARDVAHLRDPVLVVGQRAKRPACRVAQVGPEGRVGVGRHLEVAEALIVDQHLKLGAVNVVVHPLAGGQSIARELIHFAQRLLPALAPLSLRGRVDPRQVIGERLVAVLAARQLLLAPAPFALVDGAQALVRRVLACLGRAATHERGGRRQ
jgi:hypothetical protein